VLTQSPEIPIGRALLFSGNNTLFGFAFLFNAFILCGSIAS